MEENKVEEQNGESQKRLIDLMKELSEIRASNMKLSFAIDTREFMQQLDDMTKGLRDGIAVMAKYYGTKAQKLAAEYVDGQKKAEQVKAYEDKIDKLRARYKKGLRAISKKRVSLENREEELLIELDGLAEDRGEIETRAGTILMRMNNLVQRRDTLKQMAAQIANDDDPQLEEQLEAISGELNVIKAKYAQYEAQIRQMQKKQQEIEQREQAARQELNDVADLLEANKQERERYKEANKGIIQEIETNKKERKSVIALMPQQNIFQRMIGALVNKINGLNKFKEQVSIRVDEMANGIPLDEENENSDNAVETISEIIIQARAARDDMIAKLQKKLEAKRAKNKVLQERREAQNNNALDTPGENGDSTELDL